MHALEPTVKTGRKPAIIPMSSETAEILENSKQQFESLGFTVDTDSTADKISAAVFSNGVNGKTVSGTKKIYPNDPCPCGSGKKYKQCCGRKRK